MKHFEIDIFLAKILSSLSLWHMLIKSRCYPSFVEIIVKNRFAKDSLGKFSVFYKSSEAFTNLLYIVITLQRIHVLVEDALVYFVTRYVLSNGILMGKPEVTLSSCKMFI